MTKFETSALLTARHSCAVQKHSREHKVERVGMARPAHCSAEEREDEGAWRKSETDRQRATSGQREMEGTDIGREGSLRLAEGRGMVGTYWNSSPYTRPVISAHCGLNVKPDSQCGNTEGEWRNKEPLLPPWHQIHPGRYWLRSTGTANER